MNSLEHTSSENTNSVSVEVLVITETNTQTESISEMMPKFWILQEHLRISEMILKF